jgi:hypothetical protein
MKDLDDLKKNGFETFLYCPYCLKSLGKPGVVFGVYTCKFCGNLFNIMVSETALYKPVKCIEDMGE